MSRAIAIAYKMQDLACGRMAEKDNLFPLIPASLTKLFTLALSFEIFGNSSKIQALRKRVGIYSDNASANLLLNACGGIEILGKFSERFHKEHISLLDGSGLSRGNKASAESIFRLLKFVLDKNYFEMYCECLAKPGEGTLKDRFTGMDIKAKTGTMSGVSGLAGYGIRKSGNPIIFCTMINVTSPNDLIGIQLKKIETNLIKKAING